MNIQDMTDAEVYELGLEILLDKLGPTGRLRFLGRCKPHTSDYTAERHEWLDDTPDITQSNFGKTWDSWNRPVCPFV